MQIQVVKTKQAKVHSSKGPSIQTPVLVHSPSSGRKVELPNTDGFVIFMRTDVFNQKLYREKDASNPAPYWVHQLIAPSCETPDGRQIEFRMGCVNVTPTDVTDL